MIIEGKIQWTKLDKPRDNYNKQKKIMDKDTGLPERWGREYSVVLSNLSKETKIQLRDAGLLDKVKNKMDDQEDFITFKLDEFDSNGDPNEFKVVNGETGEPWDWEKDGLIGNGSFGAVKFNVWKKPGIKARIYPLSLLVTEHIEYEAPEGSGEYEDADDWSNYAKVKPNPKPVEAKPVSKKIKRLVEEDELNDDIPY